MNSQLPLRECDLALPAEGLLGRVGAYFGHKILDRVDGGLAYGAIHVVLPDNSFRILGGQGQGPVGQLSIGRWRVLLRMLHAGSVGLYEAWEAGEWDSPDPVALFDVMMRNRATLGSAARPSAMKRLAQKVSRWKQRNSRVGAKRNILAHYDLGNDFYAAWLDATMSYSSALFEEPIDGAESLEEAQRRKVGSLLGRLQLTKGSTVLEVGCGWGYLSRALAEAGHQVTAITLSPAQMACAEEAASTLPKPPIYQLRDYRDVSGQFDAIASVEMVEAVGERWWPAYLDMIARSLKPGGRAALQFIIIADDVFEDYAAGMDFIQAYIFPGGMLLSERKFRALAEAKGLIWEAPHHFGLHYAETLKCWRKRFDAAVEEGTLPAHFDTRFIRLWRYYLMYCEGGFRSGGIDVAQVTLRKAS